MQKNSIGCKRHSLDKEIKSSQKIEMGGGVMGNEGPKSQEAINWEMEK